MNIGFIIALLALRVRVLLAARRRRGAPQQEAVMAEHPQQKELDAIWRECKRFGSAMQLENRWLHMHINLYRKKGRPGPMLVFWREQLRLLRADPRVSEVVMTNRNLFVTTNPLVVYQNGLGLYFGRNLIQIPRSGTVNSPSQSGGYRFTVYCIESGRHNGTYTPTYSLNGFGFCFGNNLDYILRAIEEGTSVAEAVFTMLDGFVRVNSGSWRNFLRDFRTVASDGTIEPARGV